MLAASNQPLTNKYVSKYANLYTVHKKTLSVYMS